MNTYPIRLYALYFIGQINRTTTEKCKEYMRCELHRYATMPKWLFTLYSEIEFVTRRPINIWYTLLCFPSWLIARIMYQFFPPTHSWKTRSPYDWNAPFFGIADWGVHSTPILRQFSAVFWVSGLSIAAVLLKLLWLKLGK
jgi:hypothetical protein